jgi:hypothetical protein
MTDAEIISALAADNLKLRIALELCKGHADNLPSDPEWLGAAAQQIADIAKNALGKAEQVSA